MGTPTARASAKTFDEMLGASSVAGPREKRRALAAYMKRVLEPAWRVSGWGKVIMGDAPLPALCKVTPHAPASYAPPQTFDIVCTAPVEHLGLLCERVSPMFRDPPKAFSVEHPEFQQRAVREVIVIGVTVPERAPEVGCFRLTIKCVEYTGRPKPAKKRRR